MSLPALSKRPALTSITPTGSALKEADPKQFLAMLEKGMQRNVIHRVESKEVNEADHTAEFVVNSNMDDRDREIVLPEAVIASRDIYMQNPVFLWGHRHRGNPEDILGTCVQADLIENNSKIKCRFQYDVEIFERTAKVFEQVKKGTVRAVSIGFIPLEWVTAWDGDEMIDRLPAYAAEALKSGKVWVVYTKVEWVETSQVPIGSNRQALAASLGARNAEDSILERLYEALTGKTLDSTETSTSEVDVSEVKKSAESPTEPEEKVETDVKQHEPAAESETEPESKGPELSGPDQDEAGGAETKEPAEVGQAELEERVAALEAELAGMKDIVKELLSAHVKALMLAA